MSLDKIATAIKQTSKSPKPVLIAIEGYGGSGKTTLANQLRDTLGSAYVVNIDDFIVKEKLNEPSWDKGGFDRDRLERQVLLPASKQEPVQYEELIWETNTLSEPKIVPPIDYLIVEGISSYHPDIAHYYDYKIWIDTPIEIAKKRGHERDKANKNADKWDLWAENDLRYQEKYHPEQTADFILSNEETKLNYGFVSSPVKIGNTVHRQSGPWTPTIHALLNYLHQHGFIYSPLPLGIDEQGREILNYIEGEAAVRPWPPVVLAASGIEQAAKLLRQYHDIVEGFVPSADAEWRIGKCELEPNQIIRHGDLGPWNTIWQDTKLTALIDWDFAQPGERIDDVAQMAYYFVPLRGEDGWAAAGFQERPDMARRLSDLVKSYGMFSPKEVIETLIVLLEKDREITKRLGEKGAEPWASFMKRGDLEDSLKDSNWLESNKDSLLE